MSFVLDTSVTMSWLFEDEVTEQTEHLLDSLNDEEAWVPALWAYEVGNVLVIAERRGRITEAQERHFTRLLLSLPIQVIDTGPGELWDGALYLARSQRLSVYDAAYLDLAMKTGLPLATLDTKLRDTALLLGVEVTGT